MVSRLKGGTLQAALAILAGDCQKKKTVAVDGDVTTTYEAFADPGAAESSAQWLARRTTADSAAGSEVVEFADGNGKFDNVATDLTALSYT